MQTGPVSIDKIDLATLMYLSNLDNHRDFILAINYIGPDSLVHLQEMSVGGQIDKKRGGVTMDDRLYWLKRFLYQKLFGAREAIIGFLTGTNEVFPMMQVLVKTSGLSELAQIVGFPLTKESVQEVILRAKFVETDKPRVSNMLMKYIAESDVGQARNLMIFITGGVDTKSDITIAKGRQGALPVAITCSNTLGLPEYSSYEALKKALDMALESYDNFSLA
jgi:hypothetical protein